jgi:hypothetical protein
MSMTFFARLFGVTALACASTAAFSHATLETPEARAGSTYKAVMRITHGCNGEAVHTVRIRIPQGMHSVRPMPKPGWTLTLREGDYAQPVQAGNRQITRGVIEVVWSGGQLDDAHFDEFVLRGGIARDLSEPRLFFPVVQECATSKTEWTDIPAAGADPHGLKHPAAMLRIIPAQASAAPTGNGVSHSHAAASHDHGMATSAPVKVGPLRIEAPWTRATPAGARVAGGYMRITNTGSAPDRLIGGTFPLAGRFEVHEMAVTNGVMTMRELSKGLEIAPGQTVELKPGGFHVMFMDLKQPVAAGQPLRGTLVFEKAGTVEITYQVAPIGARGAPGAPAHHH